MTADLPFRRVLLAACTTAAELRTPFADAALAGWQVAEADTWERAHFLLHHDACDVLLVDESLGLGSEGLAWLSGPRETPVVQLTRPTAECAAAALTGGADVWLPRDMALAHPRLLAAGLDQALRWAELRRRLRLAGSSLQDSRDRVGRLVDLLWHSTPLDPHARWFTQRHMLERLQEELARTARHGTPFSVVLGEVRRPDREPAGTSVTAWAAERVRRVKRCCDVAGQYGPHGFMLLLAHTAEAGAVTFCRRLEETLAEDARRDGEPVVASFGIASCPDKATPQGLLRRAEEELEAAEGRTGDDRGSGARDHPGRK
jgi:diguanylate cyclase (GGDEF)-like protein